MPARLKPEVWLRGPIPEIPVLLQPVAFALMQAEEDVGYYMQGFPEESLWKEPAGRASVGFHLQHLTGVLGRMLTYAEGKALQPEQLETLKAEGVPHQKLDSLFLIEKFQKKVKFALCFLKTIPEECLKEKRTVGRRNLPSTVIGILFHAGEHCQRHSGQLLVTISVIKNETFLHS